MTINIKKGGCLCGNFKYEFDTSKVISTHHCHCTDCQKSTGSGKATIIMVPVEEIRKKGELKFFIVKGTDGSHVNRGFFPNCGSPIISFVSEMSHINFIKAGSLDNSSWIEINSSFWNSSEQPWSPIDTYKPSFIRNPE